MSDTNVMPVGDTGAALDFLQRWLPGGPWALTSIVPDGVTDTRTFAASDLAAMGAWIEARQGSQNLYFHVNPLRRAVNAKASKEDVARLAYLHVDIDPRAGENHEAERERALKMLRGFRHPPTAIVDSGGGFQGFWRLTPGPELEIAGLLPKAQELEAYNIQLETEFGADHCHNVDRIMRIPGTINLPTKKKLKKGRVPVLASLVSWDDSATYRLSQFIAAVRVQRGDEGLASSSIRVRVTGNLPPVGVDELREWASANNKTIRDHTLALIATGDDPVEPGKYASRSEALFKVCCDLVRAEVPDDMIFAVVTGPNEIASSVREKRDWEAYAQRQIERAHEEAIHPVLRKMNERHAVIGDLAGKCRIISITPDEVLGRTRITKSTFEDFRNRYNNRKIDAGPPGENGQPAQVGIGTFWINHPNRRQYDTIVFAPNRNVPDAYNLWQGFACSAIPGDNHERFLLHVKDNICSGNLEHYTYLLGWMARVVQFPDRTGEVAVIFRGKRGTGKSKFAKVFGSLFGRHFLQVADSKHLVGSFNAHLRDTVLLFGDEAFFAGDKRHEGVLKTLITEESIVIEGKGVDAEAAPNYTHTMLASNDDWVVPAGLDERRFFVLDVGEGRKQAHDYFEAIDADIAGGGRENLLHFLLSYNLENFQVRKVPQTRALQDQKLLSMKPEEQWMYEKLFDGRMAQNDTEWKRKVVKDSLYKDYAFEMDLRKQFYRASRTQLTKFLIRACPPGSLVMKQELCEVPTANEFGVEYLERKRAYVYHLPDLAAMRAHWDKNFGGPFDWPAWEGSQDQLEEPEGSPARPF